MERPRDLRAVCQAGKGGDPAWYVIHRQISIYGTWIVLRAGIPLGAISLAMLGLGVLGAGLVAVNGGTWNLLGFALLYFVFLLDKMDGEVARYRGIESVHGILLDRFYHRLVEPCLFVAVALHQVNAGAGVGLLAVAAAVAILANAIDENQHLAPYILLKHLRETGRAPAAAPRGAGVGRVAAWFRPLKMFRMFIIAVPAFAASYVIQAITGWPAPTYYLAASAFGLALYLAFQCVYYYGFRLDAEISSILTSFPHLTEGPARPAPNPRVVAVTAERHSFERDGGEDPMNDSRAARTGTLVGNTPSRGAGPA
jgi:phosphatidylglycerophosphate synthase